ncbi:hypothetical protein CAPTEDRAFT_218782 [Capitella teleta]|uniref:Uncharacterized protein n=1 Tax=Capitella teleta TaxID=283909 RepID=R7TBW3_CAPTE|nr:hypothetical protein CAPTEDRAFT_218782 [Capitella teleta]|eukprot:ELT88586.1 hypothetical protein CAPTEDRAFT_218782 [Capitella teleta]
MTKGSLNEDSSHIGNVDISVESEAESSDDPKQVNALCYYRLVPKSASPLSLSLEGEESAQSSHYMICLLASTDALLDLFRPDLDAFCCQLVVQLNSFDTDCIEKEAQRLLCNWYQTTATYLCSCLAKFNSNIKFIIYASVMNAKVEVRGADDELCTQVERFVKCCSLSEMLNSSEMSGSGSGDILLVDTKVMAESTSHTSPLIIEFKDGAFTFSNHACTKYCEDWAMALTQGDMNNPAYLKQVIDNYKLKAIQDLNTLKRHVRQAEASHYSLFKCLTYLQSCGNEAVLMRLAQNELQSSSESSSVLSVLNEYIQENSHQI